MYILTELVSIFTLPEADEQIEHVMDKFK